MAAIEREPPAVAAPPPSADAIPTRLRRIGVRPRQVLAMTVIGTLVLGSFASHDLSSWLRRMGDSGGLVPIQHAAVEWDAAMTRLGLAAPFVFLRNEIHRLLDLEWPSRAG